MTPDAICSRLEALGSCAATFLTETFLTETPPVTDLLFARHNCDVLLYICDGRAAPSKTALDDHHFGIKADVY